MTIEHPGGLHVGSRADDAVVIARSLDTPEAFDAVFERHHAVVFRYAASRVGPEAAEDLVGDVFLAAFAVRAKFDPTITNSALPWLLGITTRLIARHREQERSWFAKCAVALQESQSDSDEDAIARVDAGLVGPQLGEALGDLPAEQLEPLLLYVLAELSYEEIAVALAVPIGTVRSRISRGRARLAGELDGVPR